MSDGLYDTPRSALEDLTDYPVLERVAVAVLQRRGYPGLVITESTGDLGRDGFVTARYGERDETVLLVSARKDWSAKLDEDLDRHLEKDEADRPDTAIYVTSRAATEKYLEPRRAKAVAAGVTLEVWTQARLALELEKDDLRAVAERELRVRPTLPGVLQTVAAFRHRHGRQVPGLDAEVVGRVAEYEASADLLDTGDTEGRAPVMLVVGSAGIGKTRLAVDVAHDHGATLVVPTRVSLRREDLDRVPVDGPAVLVVDDAHRSSGLSGLPAMLQDPRYDRVAVILTVRPGREQEVLDQLGIGPSHVHRLWLRPIADHEIDQIVRDHGIIDEPFRRHVIQAAQGIPLIAHEACLHIADHGLYHPRDTIEILRCFLASRLAFLDDPPDRELEDRRRAIAVAVAAYAGERNDRSALAALAPAITSLPPEPDRLDSAINDLLDTGLIEHPDTPPYLALLESRESDDEVPQPAVPELEETRASSSGGPAGDTPDLVGYVEPHHDDTIYVVRPDAAGPVLLAEALTNAHRVRLNVTELLRLLGRRVTFAVDRDVDDSVELGGITPVLGIPRPRADDDHLKLDVTALAKKLGALARAADIANHPQTRTLLRRAVADLFQVVDSGDRLNVSVWSDVVTLAGQAAAVAPALIADLRAALFAGWPPPPAPQWPFWTDEAPISFYRGRMERLVKQTADQVRPLDHLGADVLMPWVLDTAWLARPVLHDRVGEHVRQAAKALSTTRTTRGVDTDDAALARRAGLREAIATWLDYRQDTANTDLPVHERGVRPPATAIVLACTALEPLLSLLTMEIAQVPAKHNEYTWSEGVLADRPETAAELDRTLDTVVGLLDRLLTPAAMDGGSGDDDGADLPGVGNSWGDAADALKWIVNRPVELIGESARGFGGGDQPLPDYAVDVLTAASDRLTAAIAERWDQLPLMVRHAAVRGAVYRANIGRARSSGGERDVTVTAVASRGDAIAVRADADASLAPVLTLLPVDADISAELAGHGPATVPLVQRRNDASELGTSLSLTEAVALLELVSDAAGSEAHDMIKQFAVAAGRTAGEPQVLLDALEYRACESKGRFRGDSFLLGALADGHPDAVTEWLFDHLDLDQPDIIELSIDTSPDLAPGAAALLHQQIITLIISSHSVLGRGEDKQGEVLEASAIIDRLARALAWQLGASALPPRQRLDGLLVLGLDGPHLALDQVAMSIGRILRPSAEASVSPDGVCAAEDPDRELLSSDDAATVHLRAGLVNVLRRSLTIDAARCSNFTPSAYDNQHMIAFAVIPLLTAAPREMASLLFDRCRMHPEQPLPEPWHDEIVGNARQGAFTEAVDALIAAAASGLGDQPLGPQTAQAVAKMTALLRGDTSPST